LGLLNVPSLARPRWDAHKYELGHIALRAGENGMAGAAVLAAIGALRGGAGLVTVLPDSEAAAAVAAQVPEAIVRSWGPSKDALPRGMKVLLVGPGGAEEAPDWEGPMVVDASALGIGEGRKWLSRPHTILTPHEGEFSRLFGFEIGTGTRGRLAAVQRALAECQDPSAVLVLKGAQTLVAGGGSKHIYVNPTGHPGLSTGGSGDFLAGLMAARYALDTGDPLKAACDAVWLHGASADRLGAGPLMVSDLGPSLSQLLREIQRA
jgi:NAD(P)H-hydrate epimerase